MRRLCDNSIDDFFKCVLPVTVWANSVHEMHGRLVGISYFGSVVGFLFLTLVLLPMSVLVADGVDLEKMHTCCPNEIRRSA